MTTLDLNTALANLTPGNTLREEAFIAISAHLLDLHEGEGLPK